MDGDFRARLERAFRLGARTPNLGRRVRTPRRRRWRQALVGELTALPAGFLCRLDELVERAFALLA
jgi:hypothetical protein